MSRRTLLAAALASAALALAPSAAAAASPLSGSFRLSAGPYRPDIDSGFDLSAAPTGTVGPYQTFFGTQRPMLYRLEIAKALPWRQAGALELGLSAGYWQAKGKGIDSAGAPTSEQTALKMVPTALTATWRLDPVWERLGIPFVPFGRVSLERYNWWVTGPGGSTVKSGATNGFSYGGGLGLVLNFVDPGMARELDADAGVNYTMITAEISKTKVDDFGARTSWSMSDARATTLTFGLLFVY